LNHISSFSHFKPFNYFHSEILEVLKNKRSLRKAFLFPDVFLKRFFDLWKKIAKSRSLFVCDMSSLKEHLNDLEGSKALSSFHPVDIRSNVFHFNKIFTPFVTFIVQNVFSVIERKSQIETDFT
jgi:hypothetical protein